eukprot:scaffold103385_cov66-Phaeocystis_antarctica.AAC.2
MNGDSRNDVNYTLTSELVLGATSARGGAVGGAQLLGRPPRLRGIGVDHLGQVRLEVGHHIPTRTADHRVLDHHVGVRVDVAALGPAALLLDGCALGQPQHAPPPLALLHL